MNGNKELWVRVGYEVFSQKGESGLKVELLAKKTGISKSSFYHHFADLEVFMVFLMDYHLQQSALIAQKEKEAQSIDPDLIHVLLEHKTDLLFNRQLRFNQQNPLYFNTLQKSNQIVGNEFVALWKKDLKLSLSQAQIESLFELALENFYLQINADNLNYAWLSGYFSRLKKIAANLS